MNDAKETSASLYIMRQPHVFGQWRCPNYNSVVATFCHNIARNREIQTHDRDAEIELVYIDDLVTAMWSNEIFGPRYPDTYFEEV